MKHTIAEGVAPSWRRINRKPDDIRTRVRSTRLSPTEQRDRRSLHLDKMSTRDALRLMLGEESLAVRKILKEESAITKGIEVIAKAFTNNGRLFYVGAGASGRLGILDASECPPTFRTSPELVQGLIAGGQMAVWRSVEGAEDDSLAGARAIQFRNLNNCDVVVGIAASGTTPFVWGALAEAKGRGAKTIWLL